MLAGEVPVWRARLIARETTDLSVEAALFADRLIAATPRRIGQVQAARLVQEARLYFDPDRALADEEEALAKRGVWLRHGSAPATTDITMTLDTPDALLFDQTVTRIAGDLNELGDTEDLEVRRARAVGILADPQHALDLLVRPRRGSTQPRARAGATNLYVHLTPADLAADLDEHRCRLDREARRRHHPAARRLAHPVRSSRHQDHPAPRPRPRRRPRPWTSTTHPKPCARPLCCATPTASSPAAAATPGPATSTTSPNTYRWKTADHRAKPGPEISHPLCRGHHRVKTHTAWHYKRLDDGSYVWTAPTGHQYRVTPAFVARATVSSDRSLRSLLDPLW